MKARIVMMALAIALFTMAVGCKYIPESVAPNTAQTGEVWYVKQTWFLLTWKTQVFYCPAPKSPGPATCIAAIMHEEGEMPAGGFGQPQPQPMPAQPAPASGQPAAPAGGGFGQPAPTDPNGFGQPAPPAQPGAPGYQPQPPAPTPPPPPPPSY